MRRRLGRRVPGRRATRRAADDQFVLQQLPGNPFRPAIAARLEADDQIRRKARHGGNRLPHGGEFRPNMVAIGASSKPATESWLGRSVRIFAPSRSPRPPCHRCSRKSRVGGDCNAQHPLGALTRPSRELEIAGLDQVEVDGNLVRAHFVDEAEVALFRRAMLGPAQHEADAPMSEIQQMRGHLARGRVVIDADRGRRAQIVFRARCARWGSPPPAICRARPDDR